MSEGWGYTPLHVDDHARRLKLRALAGGVASRCFRLMSLLGGVFACLVGCWLSLCFLILMLHFQWFVVVCVGEVVLVLSVLVVGLHVVIFMSSFWRCVGVMWCSTV